MTYSLISSMLALYLMLGFLNMLILDATDPHTAHADWRKLVTHDLVLWPISLFVMIKDLVQNWDTKCDSH